MTAVDYIARASQELPALPGAHWLIRLPLAAIILQQGFSKVPLTADDAASFGVAFGLWGLAALGEILCGLALILGGFLRNWVGEVMTRAAGLGIALIVVSVLAIAYAAPILDILLYNQFHVLLLVGGLFFALRGNHA